MASRVRTRETPESESRPRARRFWKSGALLAGAAVLMVYLIGVAFTAPNACGWFGDDAIYLVTAKALAVGHGYRRIDLPGEPHQTKYPVLYPVLLSLIWRVADEYPANLPWLRLPNAVLAAAAVVLGIWYAARYLPLGKFGLGVLAVLCLTTPELRLYSYFTMSELLFGGLAIGALLLAERAVATVDRRRVVPAILCGLVGGLAFLSRSIGLTLIVAVVAWALYRKRFAAAVLSGLVGAVFVAGCWWWQHGVAAADGAVREAALLQYELDYGAWVPHAGLDAVRVASQNFFRIAFASFFFILRLPVEWLQRANAEYGWRLVLAHMGVWSCLLVSLIGYVASARTRLTAAHVFLLAYTGAVLVWPFEPIRFLAPIFLLMIGFQLLGWSYVGRWLGRVGFVRSVRFPVALVAGLGLTGLYVAHHRVLPGFQGQTCRILAHRVDLAEHHHLTEQLRQNTPADVVIAAQSSPEIYLATGRKGVGQIPSVDPVGCGYSSSRDWRTFYLVDVPDEAERVKTNALQRLDRAYREVGVGFLVLSGRNPPGIQAALAAHRAAFPDRYRMVYRPAGANVAVFQILDGAAEGRTR